MIKQLKTFTIQLVAGANIATIIVMCLVGYSDRLNPVDHPVLSCVGMTFPLFLLANLAFLLFWVLFKFRMVIIPIAGYLLAYVPITIYMPLNMRSTPPEEPSSSSAITSVSTEATISTSKALRLSVTTSSSKMLISSACRKMSTLGGAIASSTTRRNTLITTPSCLTAAAI